MLDPGARLWPLGAGRQGSVERHASGQILANAGAFSPLSRGEATCSPCAREHDGAQSINRPA